VTTLTRELRQQIRQARDQHARATVDRPGAYEIDRCEHCGASIVYRPSFARYCSDRCRNRAWYASDRGRAYTRARRERERAKAAV
jgi:hypothetical protein